MPKHSFRLLAAEYVSKHWNIPRKPVAVTNTKGGLDDLKVADMATLIGRRRRADSWFVDSTRGV